MQLGDPSAGERAERGRLDVILDQLNEDISELVEAVDARALDQLDAAEKVAFSAAVRVVAESAAAGRSRADRPCRGD